MVNYLLFFSILDKKVDVWITFVFSWLLGQSSFSSMHLWWMFFFFVWCIENAEEKVKIHWKSSKSLWSETMVNGTVCSNEHVCVCVFVSVSISTLSTRRCSVTGAMPCHYDSLRFFLFHFFFLICLNKHNYLIEWTMNAPHERHYIRVYAVVVVCNGQWKCVSVCIGIGWLKPINNPWLLLLLLECAVKVARWDRTERCARYSIAYQA